MENVARGDEVSAWRTRYGARGEQQRQGGIVGSNRSRYTFFVGAAAVIGCLALLSVTSSDISRYLSLGSIALVVGGTILAGVLHFGVEEMRTSFALARSLHGRRRIWGEALLVRELCERAKVVRREGPLALEARRSATEPTLLALGSELLVDGAPPDVVDSVLREEIENRSVTTARAHEVLSTLSSYAPAMGLIGTIVGLVEMLGTLGNQSEVGAALALALLTTLYGSVLSNLVLLPLAGRVEREARTLERVHRIIEIGIRAIARGENELMLEQRLRRLCEAPSADIARVQG